jgi:alkanesulfonate monooxygenase SsuD/methylene tetrahydromethanopterin reductase-like flavin-dependent oxidoreductase (luciferase family)
MSGSGLSSGERFAVGLFDWIDAGGGGRELGEGYRRRFELVERVEEDGFYAYQMAEHHGTPLSVAPSASVFLSALSQRTSSIRLCPLVYLLPMHDPLRLVEEICMLDHLSDGRLEVGVGRGASPYELEIFGVGVDDSRAMFQEALEVIVQGLTNGYIDYHGKFFSYDDVVVPVAPRQKPYPPLWYPTISPTSMPWIAEHGLNTVYGFGFLSPTLDDTAQQRVVFDTVGAEHAGAPGRINGHVAAPKFGLMRQIFIADSEAEAMQHGRSAFDFFYKSFGYLWAKHDNPRFPRNPSFDDYVAKGLVLCGDPDSVRTTLVHAVDATGADYFTGAFAFGDMPIERVHHSLDLFNTEIRPALDNIAQQRTTSVGSPSA